MPKVSIITPLYNGAAFIEEAVRSVISQTYPDWEMIIADDCSTDHPEIIISRLMTEDGRIRLIRLDRNTGVAGARNAALDEATGDYIAFLDGDDLWKPEKLQRQLSMMEANDWAFSFTSYEIMKPDGTPAGKIIHAPRILDYRHYLRNTIIGCLTVMIDRRRTGELRMPSIRSSQDMALWLGLMKRGFVAHGIAESLAFYRLVPASNSANKFKAAMDVWRVYRDFEKLSFRYSLFNFAGYAINAILKRK